MQNNKIRGLSLIVFVLLTTLTIDAKTKLKNSAPVNYFSKDHIIKEWLITGPFPNHMLEKPDEKGATRYGFNRDFLTQLRKEEKAVITRDTVVQYTDEKGKQQEAKTVYLKSETGIVNFEEIFGGIDYKVAYAFSYIYSSKKQEVHFFFGSDDCPKIWVNHKLVHDNWMGGRGIRQREDHVFVKLNKGLNPVLIKVEEGWGDWRFILEVFTKKQGEKLQDKIKKREKLKQEWFAFQNLKIKPKWEWSRTFVGPRFPEVVWEFPELVKKMIGDVDFKSEWFNNRLEKVTNAKEPGRYMVYLSGKSKQGKMIRRSLTLYCQSPDWKPWEQGYKLPLEYLEGSSFNKKAWIQRKDDIAKITGKVFLEYFYTENFGPVLLSYFHEMKPIGKKLPKTETPWIIHDDNHLALKRRILKIENKYKPFEKPAPFIEKKKTCVNLKKGSAEQARVKNDCAKKIRALCKQWYKESKEPFTTLVARNGVIIIHEAFGKIGRKRVKKDTPFYIASITKSLAGLLFAQFIDQGLIKIDDPVGKYLPDFPVKGDKKITLRHCFTHTTGLFGHYMWDGMHNPWLENVIANGLAYTAPGQVHDYNGMGYDLAGKVMEMVSGKSIFRLFHENFFQPLGMKNTEIDDLACATTSTAEDLAKVAQLILNKGVYNNKRFFSEKVYTWLLPTDLTQFYPEIIGIDWGIGLTYMPGVKVRASGAGKNGVPADHKVMVKNTIGHGAASSSIFRIDLDHNLIIIQVRNTAGPKFDEYYEEFMNAIGEGLL